MPSGSWEYISGKALMSMLQLLFVFDMYSGFVCMDICMHLGGNDTDTSVVCCLATAYVSFNSLSHQITR